MNDGRSSSPAAARSEWSLTAAIQPWLDRPRNANRHEVHAEAEEVERRVYRYLYPRERAGDAPPDT